MLKLIDSSLTSGIADKGQFEPTGKGSPQGGLTPPLLTNLEDKLKLTVTQEKTHLANLDKGIPCLGFEINNFGVSVPGKSIRKLSGTDGISKFYPIFTYSTNVVNYREKFY